MFYLWKKFENAEYLRPMLQDRFVSTDSMKRKRTANTMEGGAIVVIRDFTHFSRYEKNTNGKPFSEIRKIHHDK